jgi:hypothetical protein
MLPLCPRINALYICLDFELTRSIGSIGEETIAPLYPREAVHLRLGEALRLQVLPWPGRPCWTSNPARWRSRSGQRSERQARWRGEVISASFFSLTAVVEAAATTAGNEGR